MKMIPSKTEASVWADAVRIAGPFAYTGETGARRYFKLVQRIARGILHGAKEQSCNASHAPSDGSGTPRVDPIVSSTGPSSSSPSSSSGSAADPSAAVPAPATILPPLEIADHADALGWTEGSRVYQCRNGGAIRVYPSARKWTKEYGVQPTTAHHETETCVRECTLLPNRRVPVEGEKYSDIHDLHATGLARNTDGTPSPRPAKSAGEVAEEVVEKIKVSVFNWKPDVWGEVKTIIAAAIERERGSR